jgi:hypothetical protein
MGANSGTVDLSEMEELLSNLLANQLGAVHDDALH